MAGRSEMPNGRGGTFLGGCDGLGFGFAFVSRPGECSNYWRNTGTGVAGRSGFLKVCALIGCRATGPRDAGCGTNTPRQTISLIRGRKESLRGHSGTPVSRFTGLW